MIQHSPPESALPVGPAADLSVAPLVVSQLEVVSGLVSAAAAESRATGEEEKRLRNARILILDDEPINLVIAQQFLREAGFGQISLATDARTILTRIRAERPDVVLLDLIMPDVHGLEVLRLLRDDPQLQRIPVIVLTTNNDRKLKLAALELGASDFLSKPLDPTDLLPRIRIVLAAHAHQDGLRQYAQDLERQVQQRTAELEASRLEVIYCLGRAAEYRDNETGKHVVRVGRFVGVIARALGLDEATASLLETAAPLHDMGKIGIPDSVLLKPGRLDEHELVIMRKHAEYGCDIVSTLNRSRSPRPAEAGYDLTSPFPFASSPLLRVASVIALTHHERWDGTGYPRGLRGEEIPLEGRITAVADVFDALSSDRPYKKAQPFEECLRIMEENRGTHFDPRVLDAFLSRRDEIRRIQQELPD